MPRTPEQNEEMSFPLKGMDISSDFDNQPELTTPSGVNVRAYCAQTLRHQGGSRAGLNKLIDATVNGARSIQCLDLVTRMAGLGTGLIFRVFVTDGGSFILEIKLDADTLARTTELYFAENSPTLLPHPPEFPTEITRDAYYVRVSAVDQDGGIVQINDADSVTSPLAVVTKNGVTFLGMLPTVYSWTKVYSDPTFSAEYTTTITLLDNNGDVVSKADVNGIDLNEDMAASFVFATVDRGGGTGGKGLLRRVKYSLRKRVVYDADANICSRFAQSAISSNVITWSTKRKTDFVPQAITTNTSNPCVAIFGYTIVAGIPTPFETVLEVLADKTPTDATNHSSFYATSSTKVGQAYGLPVGQYGDTATYDREQVLVLPDLAHDGSNTGFGTNLITIVAPGGTFNVGTAFIVDGHGSPGNAPPADVRNIKVTFKAGYFLG